MIALFKTWWKVVVQFFHAKSFRLAYLISHVGEGNKTHVKISSIHVRHIERALLRLRRLFPDSISDDLWLTPTSFSPTVNDRSTKFFWLK